MMMANLSSRSFILGVLSVFSLKSRLAALGQDTRMSTTMSSLIIGIINTIINIIVVTLKKVAPDMIRLIRGTCEEQVTRQ